MIRRLRAITVLVTAALATASAPLWSGPPPFTLEKSAITSGGNASAAADFELTASVGQPLAGRIESGTFVLQAGFWAADTPQVSDLIFKDSYE